MAAPRTKSADGGIRAVSWKGHLGLVICKGKNADIVRCYSLLRVSIISYILYVFFDVFSSLSIPRRRTRQGLSAILCFGPFGDQLLGQMRHQSLVAGAPLKSGRAQSSTRSEKGVARLVRSQPTKSATEFRALSQALQV